MYEEKRGKLILIAIILALVIFISGCSHSASPTNVIDKKVAAPSTPTKTKTTATTETITKSTGTGLGTLCSSIEECFAFCKNNFQRCFDFCTKNSGNELCKTLSGYQKPANQPYQRQVSFGTNLPECSGQKLTISHINPSDVREIIPLGNLNPPDHTLPTEHMYFHIDGSEADVKSPGDITITELRATIYLDSAGKEVRRDYGITFALCKDLFGYFLHITKLEQDFELLVNEKCSGEAGTEHGGGNFKSCNVQPNKKILAGTLIGKVSSSSDFGMYDYRVKHEYANPSRYTSRSPYIVCPLENFDDATKVSLYGKVQRTADPRCGKTVYDVKGTLQGNWFYGNVMAEREWQNHLAFAYDNKNPQEATLSVGGVFMTSGRVKFSPQNSGTTNRAFDQVTADGNVYCYTGEFIPGNIYSDGSYSRASSGFKGAVLVKLLNENELQIEEQSSCSSILQNPTTYRR